MKGQSKRKWCSGKMTPEIVQQWLQGQINPMLGKKGKNNKRLGYSNISKKVRGAEKKKKIGSI